MFDLLMSADMMMSDPDGMTDLLVSKLGIHSHPRWRQASSGYGSANSGGAGSDERRHSLHFREPRHTAAEIRQRVRF